MKEIPANVSESTKKRNPTLYPSLEERSGQPYSMPFPKQPKPRRLRQSTKPLLNKLEQEWFDVLRFNTNSIVHCQGIKFKLANGLTYLPDFFCFDWMSAGEFARPTAFEVKGPWATDDAIAKVKMFATAYPEIRVILVWKDDNKQWCQQRVLA